MGKFHWERHAAKPTPLKADDLGDTLLIVRERPKAPSEQRFVATIRYKTPPTPGQYVKSYAYGRTPEHAEMRVLAGAIR